MMVSNHNHSGRASSLPAGLAWGAIVNIATTGSMAAILALLLEKERIDWNGAGYGILAMIMLSAFLGAVVAYRKVRHMQLMVCAMSGVVYLGILLSVTALFFGGQYEAIGVTSLLVAGGVFCAAMPRQGNRRGKRSFNRK